MSVPQANIETALLDVRKAYRLLHDYQRAALDAAKYIGAQLGLTYAGGYSRFSEPAPKQGKGHLDNWSWDWLNLMFYEFQFEDRTGENVHLSMWLFSDTGYFLEEGPEGDKKPVSSFAPVEMSGTKVGFALCGAPKKHFGEMCDDRDAVRRFLSNDGELPEELMKDGVVALCCDFSRLRDEGSTDTVITELIERAKSAGLSLNRVKKST